MAEAFLKLALDEIHVRRDGLAVDDPGADLDGLADGLRGRPLLHRLIAHHARGQLVDDLEALDHQAVLEGPDRGLPLLRVVERQLWLLGCLHGLSNVVGAPDET